MKSLLSSFLMSRSCDLGTNRLTDNGSCNILITHVISQHTFPRIHHKAPSLHHCAPMMPSAWFHPSVYAADGLTLWSCWCVYVCVLMPRVPLPLKRLTLAHVWGGCAETVSMATLSFIGRPCSFRAAIWFQESSRVRTLRVPCASAPFLWRHLKRVCMTLCGDDSHAGRITRSYRTSVFMWARMIWMLMLAAGVL